jgi:hypothetical protein
MSLQFMRWDLVLLALIVGVPYGLIALAGVRDWFKERAWQAFQTEYYAAHPGVTRWEPPSEWRWEYKYQGIK